MATSMLPVASTKSFFIGTDKRGNQFMVVNGVRRGTPRDAAPVQVAVTAFGDQVKTLQTLMGLTNIHDGVNELPASVSFDLPASRLSKGVPTLNEINDTIVTKYVLFAAKPRVTDDAALADQPMTEDGTPIAE